MIGIGVTSTFSMSIAGDEWTVKPNSVKSARTFVIAMNAIMAINVDENFCMSFAVRVQIG